MTAEKCEVSFETSRYLVNDINKQVKLKNVCILPACMCTYCATRS